MEIVDNIIVLGDKLMKRDYKKLANYKDSFEDLYLRHDYMNRIPNKDKLDLSHYEPISKKTAKIMYEKFRLTFNKVGFYYDDILAITRVYQTAYQGLYSFEAQPDKLELYIAKATLRKGSAPTAEEIERKNRNNLINFLRQRLNTCALFCKRKARNIVGAKEQKVYFAFTANSKQVSDSLILEDHALFGYRTVSVKEYNEIKKRPDKKMIDADGFAVIELEIASEIPTSLYASKSSTNPGDGDQTDYEISHERIEPSVEEKLLDGEDNVELESFKNRFNSLPKSQRRGVLISFIEGNKQNPHLKTELMAARKMLKTISNVV